MNFDKFRLDRTNLIRNYGKKGAMLGIAAAAVTGIIFLIIAGFGVITSVLFGVLLGIIILFGMLREFTGAVIVTSFLRIMHGEINELLTIWTSNPKITETMNFFLGLGWLKSVMVMFFFAALLSFVTGSVKFFRISSSSESKTS